MIRVGVIGANGNIGKQALEIINKSPNLVLDFIVINKNINRIENFIKNFENFKIGVVDNDLKKKIVGSNFNASILDYIKTKKYIANNNCDIILNAAMGFSGLEWTVAILKSKTTLALANKESLVVGGQYIMELAKSLNTKIIAVDSEHSAIQQCLVGENTKQVKKIILTCSGGPFFAFSRKEMKAITLEKALNHPVWNMGKKITIDSATLFNKCLEVIEARWLFDTKNIDVIVHRQGIIHSMVQFNDNSFKAQLSTPTMKIPISYALHKSNHINSDIESPEMNLTETKTLTFNSVDNEKFPALKLAYKAIEIGGSYPIILNAANEYMVSLFLKKKCNYSDIYKGVEFALSKQKVIHNLSLEMIKKVHYNTIIFLKKYYPIK